MTKADLPVPVRAVLVAGGIALMFGLAGEAMLIRIVGLAVMVVGLSGI